MSNLGLGLGTGNDAFSAGQVSRLIGQFREELHRGLSSASASSSSDDSDARGHGKGNSYRGRRQRHGYDSDELSDEYPRSRRPFQSGHPRDNLLKYDDDEVLDFDVTGNSRGFSPTNSRRRGGRGRSDSGRSRNSLFGGDGFGGDDLGLDLDLGLDGPGTHRSPLRDRVDAFRKSLDHIESDIDREWDADPYNNNKDKGYGYERSASKGRRRSRDWYSNRRRSTEDVAFGSAISVQHDLDTVISDFKKLPSRLRAVQDRSSDLEGETKDPRTGSNSSRSHSRSRSRSKSRSSRKRRQEDESTSLALVTVDPHSPQFKEDDIVEAVRKGSSSSSKKKEWFEGRIDQVTRTGTFDIRFNDGKWSYGVQKRNIRYPRLNIKTGDEVEARYLGQRWWIKGKVTAVHDDDGSFNIVYRDGGTETHVQPHLVRKLPRREMVAGHLQFLVGDSVEVRSIGSDGWERATVQGINGNGTFELVDATGKEKHEVSGYFLRRLADNSKCPFDRCCAGAPDTVGWF